jgi:hypothetical protein
MTTPQTMSTKELVDHVLTLQAKADAGDEDARQALADKAAARVNPGATTAPTAAPEPPKVDVLKDKFVVRPSGEKYYIRKLGVHQDIMVMRKCRDTRTPILLYGIPGCGKTALFEAAYFDEDTAKDPKGLGFRYVPGSGDTEVADLVGGYVPLPGGEFVWADGPLVEAMDLGLPLLVDEVALIDPKVMAVVYSVMDGRDELNITANPSRGAVSAKEGFFVAGACNPNAPGARMSEALLSRFALHVEVQVDFKLMRTMGVDPKFIAACTNLQTKQIAGEISWYPAIREMLAFKRVSETFGVETALSNIISQAPDQDRKEVQSSLERNMGGRIKPLCIG